MKQYTLDEVRAMSFEQLGAIDDPMMLMATGTTAALTVRYLVRTNQLDLIKPRRTLPEVLHVMAHAATLVPWTIELGQLIPQARQTKVVDDYVAALTAEMEHFS